MKIHKQQYIFQRCKSHHGGSLKNARKRQRPLSRKYSMHVVLRSTEARRGWSLRRHKHKIDQILKKFAAKYRVEILSYANVGNHIHLHLKLSGRQTYKAFIRAITAAIMIAVTGFSKWRPKPKNFQFWQHRPFSRIVRSLKAFKNMVDYIQINHLEGLGVERQTAVLEVRRGRHKFETG